MRSAWLARALLCAAATSLLPVTALAQPAWDTPSSSGFDLVPRTGAAGDIGFWAAGRSDQRVGSISGLLRTGLVLEEVFELGLTAGWAWTDFGADPIGITDGDHGAAANPFISGVGIVGEQRWRLRFGGGVGIPASLTSQEARYAQFYGGAIRGMSELWLWAADRVSVVGTLQLQLVPVDFLYIEASAQPALMISTRTGDPMTNVDLLPQEVAESAALDLDATIDTHAAIAIRHDNVMGGLRFRAVFNPTFETNQEQLSLEAFVRGTYRIQGTSIELFAELRTLANLDRSLGFAYDELGVWGTNLAFGLSSTPQQIPAGRYGVESVEIDGAERLDDESVMACLGTQRRPNFGIDIGLRGQPSCNEPPFDGRHILIEPFAWPFTEWPLFDENVFERDLERIVRWYRAHGFYEAQVTGTEVRPESARTIDRGGIGCGDGEGNCEVQVRFRVEEGEPVLIERMSLRGIDALPSGMREALRGELPFDRGDPFDEILYERTKQRMVRALADAGYAHARVDGDVKVNVRRHEAYVVFTVDAGRPNVIGRVCVVGYGSLPAQPMLGVSGLDAGEPFSFVALEEAQRALYGLGVLGAVEVHPEGAERNDAPTPAERDTEGEVPELREDTSAQLGHERSQEGPRVCADPPQRVREGYEAVDILIEVTPGRRYRIGFGGGFQAGQSVTFGTVTTTSTAQNAAQWDFHLALTAEDRNFLDNMIRARIEVRPRLIFNMPFLSFVPAEPSPFGVLVNGSARWPAFLGARWLTMIGQTRADLGPMPFTNFFRLDLDALLGPEATFFDNRLYLGLFAHVNYFLPTDRQPILPEDRLPETYASWIEETIRVDLRDDPRAPTLGAYFSVTSQQGFQPLSTWTMARVNAEARGYVPLFAGIVVAARFQLGLMHVFDYDHDRLLENSVYQFQRLGPPALQLTGGGASSNRGFLPGLLGDTTQEYVTVAPSDEDLRNGLGARQRPVRISGGERLWLASLEVRIPISLDFGLVAFADVGDVNRQRPGEDGVDWRWSHLQLAVGLGVRYQTIIGPLRLDIAVRPDQTMVVGENSTLPPDCVNDSASGCRPRSSYFQIGDLAIPGAFHLTIGESF
ncbi:MAG: BamA/TamA family outer membrane protein [Sandaracinaceae bacterium]